MTANSLNYPISGFYSKESKAKACKPQKQSPSTCSNLLVIAACCVQSHRTHIEHFMLIICLAKRSTLHACIIGKYRSSGTAVK